MLPLLLTHTCFVFTSHTFEPTQQAADGASALIGGLAGRVAGGGSAAQHSRPKNTLPLLTSTVKMDAAEDQRDMRCCFRFVLGAALNIVLVVGFRRVHV